MSLGLFNCRLIQPARDQLFFFAGCLAAPVPVRASSVQSPCDASCSAPTSGRARNASCVFPSQEGFVLVFRGSEAPVGCRRVHPTDSPTNSPEDPPILPIDSAIEPELLQRLRYMGNRGGELRVRRLFAFCTSGSTVHPPVRCRLHSSSRLPPHL